MIGRLRGTALDAATVDVGGVGYEVRTLTPLEVGAQVDLHVHTRFDRDGGTTLHGFERAEERDLFRALIAVPGVGPAAAGALLTLMGAEGCADAIAAGNATAIGRARGVGKAAAARIVSMCRVPDGLESTGGDVERAVADALVGLGWERTRATTRAREASAANPGADESTVLAVSLRSG